MIELRFRGLILLLCVGFHLSYIPGPSLQPLQHITLPVIVENTLDELHLDQVGATVWGAIFPSDLNDALAVAISEGASGFTGGVAAKLIAAIDGNKQSKDSTFTDGGASGIFFATRGGLRALGEFIGGSSVLITIGSLAIATLISELVKLRGRAISEQQTRVGNGPTMLQLMRFRNPNMKLLMQFQNQTREDDAASDSRLKDVKFFQRRRSTRPVPQIPKPPSVVEPASSPILGKSTPREIISDIVKWLVYDVTVPNVAYVPLEMSANLGALAGIAAQIVKETEDKSNVRLSLPIAQEEDNAYLRLSRAAFEGAVQFLTYEVTRQWLLAIAPDPERFLKSFSSLEDFDVMNLILGSMHVP